jgi:plastocyanin
LFLFVGVFSAFQGVRIMIGLRLLIFSFSVLSFAACGGSYDSSPTGPSPSPASPPPAGNSVNVAIGQGADRRSTDAFGANPLNVTAGSTVVWVNNDNTSHNPIANNGAFSIASIRSGGQGSFTFSTAGTFPYHCGIHPNMVGTIVVQ